MDANHPVDLASHLNLERLQNTTTLSLFDVNGMLIRVRVRRLRDHKYG